MIKQIIQRKLKRIIKENGLQPIDNLQSPSFERYIANESASKMNKIAMSIQQAYKTGNNEELDILCKAYNLFFKSQNNQTEWLFIQRDTLTKFHYEHGIVKISAFEGDSWFLSIKDYLGLNTEPTREDLVMYYDSLLAKIAFEENPIEKRILDYSLSRLTRKYRFYYFFNESTKIYVHKSHLTIIKNDETDHQNFDIKPINSFLIGGLNQLNKMSIVTYLLITILMANYFFISIRFDTIPPNIYFSNYQHEIGDEFVVENLIDNTFDDFDNASVIEKSIVRHTDIENPGNAEVVVSILDSSKNERRLTTQVVIKDTTPPYLSFRNELDVIEYDDLSNFNFESLVLENTDNHQLLPVIINLPLQFKFVDTYKPLGIYQFDYTSTDYSGNKTTLEKIVSIVDTVPPKFDLSVRSLNLDLEDIQSYGFLSLVQNVSDNYDSSKVKVDYSSNFTYPNVGSFTYNYRAIDASDNITTRSLSVIVVDTTPPVVDVLQNLTLNVDNVSTFNPEKILNSANDNHEISSIRFDSVSILRNRLGTVDYGVTVTDVSGNQTRKITKINIVDTVAPTINVATLGITITNRLPVNSDFDRFIRSVTDNYDPNPTYSASINNNGSSRAIPGLNTVIITARDSSRNRSTARVSLTILDTIAPVLRFKNDNSAFITLTQSEAEESIYRSGLIRVNDNFLNLIDTVTDNISDRANIRVTLSTPSSYDITRVGIVSITFIVRDEANNQRTYSFVIRTVADPTEEDS